jgi:predicted amidohydrolase YtcJ
MNPRIYISLFVLLIILTVGWFKMNPTYNADLIVYGGRIYLMNENDDVAESMAIRGDRIIATGSTEEIAESFTARSRIDLDGGSAIPAMTDAHAHMRGLGMSMQIIDLVGTESADDAAALVRLQTEDADAGEWIQGRGWDQNLWPGRVFPDHTILDRAAPENPVYLTRVDGHAAWVNRSALEIAGITAGTPDPEGGRIIRDGNGEPTGVLIDAAMSLVSEHIPEPTPAQVREALRLAVNECLSYGITTVHDMGIDLETIEVYRSMIRNGEISFRLYGVIGGSGETWESYLRRGPEIGTNGGMLTVRAIKLYADGALGSRGAALLEPYSDDAGNSGLLLDDEDTIYEITLAALEGGFQVCTHAIGDRGNRIVLNAYERALERVPVNDHRLRIEHVQVVHPGDFPRFTQLDVIPSMQPIHATSDMGWAEDRLSRERARGAYAWRTLIDGGSVIPGGSDFPVEPVNPLLGIFAAETRQDVQFRPEGGWFPEQRVTRREAFSMFTSWAAHAAFEEDLKGSLETGKLADFVVYPVDIMTVDAEALPSVRPDMTVLGGKVVYENTERGHER